MIKVIKDPCPRITDCKPSTWIVEWTAEEDFPQGTIFEFRGENLRTILSGEWGEFEVNDEIWDTLWRIPRRCSFADIDSNNAQRSILRLRSLTAIEEGRTCRFTLNANPDTVPDGDFPIRVVINGREDVVNDEFSLTTRAGRPDAVRVYVRPSSLTDGSYRVVLAAEDGDGFPTEFCRPLRTTLRLGDRTVWEGHVRNWTVVELSESDLPASERPLRLNAVIDSQECTADERISNGTDNGDRTVTVTSNPIWTGDDDFTPAFGALHWHTRISGDGQRTPEAGFLMGRDPINLDFVAPGDHTPLGANWEELTEAIEFFNEDGSFNTLYGWELSSDQGHVNFYFTRADHPLNPNSYDGPSRPEEYIEDLSHDEFLAIPHHTNAVSRELTEAGDHYWREYPWGEPRPEYLRQVEIFQARGNQERETYPEGWRQQYEENGGSVQTGLDRGHPLGFVGGTDDHFGFPSVCPHHQGRIVTGAWLAERTRQGVFDALYARRTWACWDTRAIVRFSVNDVLQGGELTADADTSLTARIEASFQAPLDVLELVSNGDTAVEVPHGAEALDIETEVDLGPRGDRSYVYLRARQTDGAIVYASPVFLRG